MMIVMSDACAYMSIIDDSRSIIDEPRSIIDEEHNCNNIII